MALDLPTSPARGAAAPGSTEPQFRALDVSVRFSAGEGEEFTALADVTLDIDPGRFVCLVGPSGCGKSTLLNLMAGLLRPSSGAVLHAGTPITGPNTACGYLTQHDTLLPWSTVRNNVALGLRVKRVPKADRRPLVDEALDRVGMLAFGDRYPAQLSGGMRKRALLARTIVYEPESLLMDEPFSALDAQMRYRLHEQLLEMWERDRKTVVFVTHDLDEALLLADEIVVFGTNPGRVVYRTEVDLPRPRRMLDLREDPKFWSLWRSLWDRIDSGGSDA